MATPRNQQLRQKRVKEIAEEAASKIAAESSIEEEVVVTVEELPPAGDPASAPREVVESVRAGVASGGQFVENGLDRWIDMTKRLFPSNPAFAPTFAFDPRPTIEISFGLAEELLAIQKDSWLRLAGAVSPAAKS
jgi:hypothetical protein